MFHRSHRLFMRPPFPEDRDAIAGVLGDVGRAEAILNSKRGRNFVVVLPEQDSAPVIGAASFVPAEGGIELCVKIAQPFQGEGYGSEAARALSEIAAMLGHGERARQVPDQAFDRQFDYLDAGNAGWMNLNEMTGGAKPLAAA